MNQAHYAHLMVAACSQLAFGCCLVKCKADQYSFNNRASVTVLEGEDADDALLDCLQLRQYHQPVAHEHSVVKYFLLKGNIFIINLQT